ncbi:hypothetical protein BGZ61DRAFT_434182 [Ilyonectria robusta]|uniref:uncharacterized protein n=1 Tax=Ilyonectria robusta TaxID=1079257 RepID=UPI001E8E631D|nr:uncharacterized protein BGZ61DRAFT_434182 [Ilyonectria robusta]KAH8656919.1 hypothetical protein BGZ61DRAFT_434182 [Ilyonectria robusta]
MNPIQPTLPATIGSEELVQTLWRSFSSNDRLFNGDSVGEIDDSAYREYYERQWVLIAANCDGKFVALKAPEDINRLVQRLQTDRSREDLLLEIQNICGRANSDGECESSLDLAARILLMLRIGTVKGQFLPRRHLAWNNGTLRCLVRAHFTENPRMNFDAVKLPKSFNGWSLEMIGGIEISFTDNLAEHLLVTEDDSKVLVFSHVSFLECQRLKNQESLLPRGLAEETLRTLALLFPQSMSVSSASRSSKHSWFRQLCDRQHDTVDKRLGRCGTLHMEDRQMENFKFWRDRIVILKQAYDETTPRTLSQFWHDRRNGVQWYTFWVALSVLALTIVFGVVQCVESGYQAWKT